MDDDENRWSFMVVHLRFKTFLLFAFFARHRVRGLLCKAFAG